MAEYLVTHLTRYTYSEKVSHCHNIGYLMPQSDGRQSSSGTEINVQPRPQIFNERSDYFGNRFCYFSVEDPHSELEVVSKTRVSTAPVPFTDWMLTLGRVILAGVGIGLFYTLISAALASITSRRAAA